MIRSVDEFTIVCNEDSVPEYAQAERGWRALKVLGPLEFTLTGVLASLALPLAEARISIFALSNYDTDYLLVKEASLASALHALRAAGHTIQGKHPGEHSP